MFKGYIRISVVVFLSLFLIVLASRLFVFNSPIRADVSIYRTFSGKYVSGVVDLNRGLAAKASGICIERRDTNTSEQIRRICIKNYQDVVLLTIWDTDYQVAYLIDTAKQSTYPLRDNLTSFPYKESLAKFVLSTESES